MLTRLQHCFTEHKTILTVDSSQLPVNNSNMVRSEASKRTSSADERKAKPGGSKKINMGFGPMVTLLMFSTAMLILPLSTYFYIRNYIVQSTSIAAMGAVVVVQIIIAAYIYKAWTDENREHQKQVKKIRAD